MLDSLVNLAVGVFLSGFFTLIVSYLSRDLDHQTPEPFFENSEQLQEEMERLAQTGVFRNEEETY